MSNHTPLGDSERARLGGGVKLAPKDRTKRAHLRMGHDQMEAAFADFSFRPLWFSHEAHIRLALIHLLKYGLDQAERNMCAQIKSYAEHYGATMKYNETVTIASLRLLDLAVKAKPDLFVAEGRDWDFVAAMAQFPRILDSFKEIIQAHYSGDIFRDPVAKASFVKPDKRPFHLADVASWGD